MNLFGLFIASTLVANIILAQFLGICSFIGVSKKSSSALGMGGAVMFVTVLTASITWAIHRYILEPFNLQYMRTIVFILVIAAVVQFVEMVLKKYLPPLYKTLGVYLPLITTNCLVLAVAIINIDRSHSFVENLVYSFAISLGYTIVIYLFSTIRERLDLAATPEGFKGAPIALITATMMALAFVGFSGMA